MQHKEQRVLVLFDVQNLYYSAKHLYGTKVNFKEILKKAVSGRKLIRAIAYVIRADIKDECNFHEALNKIGIEVKAKDLQIFFGGAKKGDWDIGIAMDAVRLAGKVDTVVLVSGDGDFKDLCAYLKSHGCRTEALAFTKTASKMLKEEADMFFDLSLDLKKYLIGTPKIDSAQRLRSQNSSNGAESLQESLRPLPDSPELLPENTGGGMDASPATETTVVALKGSRDPHSVRPRIIKGPRSRSPRGPLRDSRGPRDTRDSRGPRDTRDSRGPRDTRDSRGPRDTRDSRGPPRSKEFGAPRGFSRARDSPGRMSRPPRGPRSYSDDEVDEIQSAIIQANLSQPDDAPKRSPKPSSSVEVIDMKEAVKEKEKGSFAGALKKLISKKD